MTGSEIRKLFLEFFKSKGHTIVASSSLVPQNDPTLLFANSGMVQFKDCFLGADKRAYTRATTCQKSLRISGKHNDFENVGMTARHQTFFEMLGNFSFGDYFKADAIKFAWEFITEVLKLPKDRLWATVFENDDEAYKLWSDSTDLPKARILRMGEKDNFWAMGETGPCGPCSEIYYYVGDRPEQQSEAEFRLDNGQYLEFWNLVFMQFERSSDGKLTPLPRPSVDTGMGLERTTSILQKVRSNYDTDLLRSIITVTEKLSGFKYDGSSYEIRDLRADQSYARDVAMRVIADHSRAMCFLIADGITPGSDGRGYVLRRIIRRALRHGRVLKFKEPFLTATCSEVISNMGGHYQELNERRDVILKMVDAEERKFYETLDAGLNILNREVEKLPKGRAFPGETAFLLHDTYGFPLDLTQDALKAWGLEVDVAAFERAMGAQKERSREDRRSQALVFTATHFDGPKTEFLGYRTLQSEAKLSQVILGNTAARASAGDHVALVFDATPFYAESGGQVGDTGVVRLKDAELRVIDTQKTQEKYFVHQCEVTKGEITSKQIGSQAELTVDQQRRAKIVVNHSCTHLLHSALRKVLGTHVKQAGSRVDDHSLRFDYSHFEPVTAEQLSAIQSFVNDEIRSNYPTDIRELPIEEARKAGAMALFGEKYGDVVRVVTIGPNSKELCGGTHVTQSGQIGFMMVGSETGVSAGVRRIECWAGAGAQQALLRERHERHQIAALLKSDTLDLPDKVEKLLMRSRALERDLEALKGKLASSVSGDLVERARTTPKGIKIIAEKVDDTDTETLRNMVDRLRNKLGSGVVALGCNQGDKAIVVAGITADLIPGINASSLIKEAAKVSGGRGGGKADFAQAGGVDQALLGATLDKVVELVS
ncbi:MAG: alanine--tRNA ligase [Oligoflexia bacterium]|nr:alanine--tRNA ligase [Oligoflexia bacterium]